MRKGLKRVLVGFTAAMLAVVCLLSVVGTAAEPSENLFDYRSTEDVNATEHKPSELLEGAFGNKIKLSDAEIDYLDNESGIVFRYTDTLPMDVVSTEYDRDSETLKVSATAYTYTAQNGTTVTWVPQSVTLGNKTVKFQKTADGYVCKIAGLRQSGNFNMGVTFSCDLTLSAEAAE